MTTPRSEFWNGVRAEAPILIGVMPYGLIYGVLAIGAHLPVDVALAMSFIVFAGSSQLVGTPLISAGSPWIVIVTTTFVVNLRHALYSASLAPYTHHLSQKWKWLLAYLLTDEAYAVTINHYHEPADETHKHWFFLGSGLTLWSSWQLSTAIGIFLGAQVPESWSLDFTLALTFIALVVPRLKDRPSAAAAISAGIIAVLTTSWPYKLGLMLAALIGIAIGLFLEDRSPKRQLKTGEETATVIESAA
jgi:4-azaleucine resistance transporter AzlC